MRDKAYRIDFECRWSFRKPQSVTTGRRARLLPMHPPQFNQRGLILPIVDLQVDAVSSFHDCSDRAVNYAASMQSDGCTVRTVRLATLSFQGSDHRMQSPVSLRTVVLQLENVVRVRIPDDADQRSDGPPCQHL